MILGDFRLRMRFYFHSERGTEGDFKIRQQSEDDRDEIGE